MNDVYLESVTGTMAFIMLGSGSLQPRRIATVYLMTDGWHAKSATLHTRHAWTGPFASPSDALASFVLPINA
ncbi:hypothetical protein [Agreia sp. Leaf210]|uniref:hypothetical protein n=1 Tax=Agreia sp. Leaf210 TaxID=1735682 RepID=UPI000A7ECAA8|nr:hypothetical protein [Agreia sp. Leaf210]